jgi:murein DD-endopeptidase MepM/ murein hydrolase activator NlpD
VRGRAGGNGVVLDHGFGEFSAHWHGIPGTVQVRVGQRVELGDVLFLVGNSGSSTLPHVHFQVDTGGPDPIALPVEFVDVFVNGRWRAQSMPVRGDRIRGVPPRTRVAAGPEPVLDV